MALKEGPYPVRKCPSVNQKFQAEFGVAKEESDGPRVGLPKGLGQCHRYDVPPTQYVGTDRANLEGSSNPEIPATTVQSSI